MEHTHASEYPGHDLNRLTQFSKYTDIDGLEDYWVGECECGAVFTDPQRLNVRDMQLDHAFEAAIYIPSLES